MSERGLGVKETFVYWCELAIVYMWERAKRFNFKMKVINLGLQAGGMGESLN